MSVKINAIQGFDQLPINDATALIYDQLLPFCEKEKICLSEYGNDSVNKNRSVEHYEVERKEHTLFNVEKIQKVYAVLPELVQANAKSSLRTADLAEKVEEKCGEKVSNGTVVAAMLLQGFTARFGTKHQIKIVPEFNASLKA